MVSKTITELPTRQAISLDQWSSDPSLADEWVNGNLIAKSGMTLQHSRLQSRIAWLWKCHVEKVGIGGEVYTEVPCRTLDQGRKPDVAYLTPDLLAEYGHLATLPQSFPLIAEIVSPTDIATELLAKATEYLRSGCLEVWLVFGEECLIMVIGNESRKIYINQEAIASIVLADFKLSVTEIIGG